MSDFDDAFAANIKAWLTPQRRDAFLHNIWQVIGWFIGGAMASIFLLSFIAALALPASEQPSLILVYCLSVWGGMEAVLHRMGWWGRRLRPRLWLWLAIAFGFIGGASIKIGMLLFQNVNRLDALIKGRDALKAAPQTADTVAQLAPTRPR